MIKLHPKIKLKSGTVTEDVVEGQGKLAKPGKRVRILIDPNLHR